MNNNITEDYVSFEIAKLLKEKGFSVICDKVYYEYSFNKNWYFTSYNSYRQMGTKGCHHEKDGSNEVLSIFSRPAISAPTQALAIKWIRQNFTWHIYSQWGFSWEYCIERNDSSSYSDGTYNSPEEAIEAALLYTLKHLI